MMSTTSNLAFSSRKKVATYGKAARKRESPPAEADPYAVPIGKDEDPRPPAAPRPTPVLAQRGGTSTATHGAKPERKLQQYGRKQAVPPQPVRPSLPTSPKRDAAPLQAKEVKDRMKRRKVSPIASSSRATDMDAIWSPPSSPTTSAPTVKHAQRVKSPTKASSHASSRSTVPNDVAMTDVASDQALFSPGTVSALKKLSVNKRPEEKPRRQIPIRPTQRLAPTSAPAPPQKHIIAPLPVPDRRVAPTSVPAPVKQLPGHQSGDTKRAAPAKKRRRLIDTLAAQADDSSDDGEDDTQDSRKTPEPDSIPHIDAFSPGGSLMEQPRARTYMRQESVKKKAGPKFTYSQQRTLLVEDSLMGGIGDIASDDFLLNEPLLATTTTLTPISAMEEEEEPSSSSAMRSIHELRQAGANNRAADEMDDLLDRIGKPTGKPSSSRRNGLLELSQKVQDKTFRRHFRDHGAASGLFKAIGKETDTIAAFSLVSILVTLLATSPSSHLPRMLQGQGFAQAVARLFSVTSDVSLFAKDRKSNLSRIGQQSVATLKASLLKLPSWEPFSLELLSPRTLALKSLDLVVKQAGDSTIEDEIFSSEMTGLLFSVLSDSADHVSWDWPPEASACDLYLALTLLEAHSVRAMETDMGVEWTTQHLPIVANVLEAALQHQGSRLNDLEILVLKLTLNIANNNPDAPKVFTEKGLLRTLSEAVCSTFEAVMKSVEGDFLADGLESVVLMLGVIINFSEHDPSAGQSLLEGQDGQQSPLDKLIRLFLDHRLTTAEADSEEKSQVNVAFGYLSLLLGYLSLHGAVRDRFASMHTGGNLRPLLDSIREFIAYHKVADDAMEQAGDPTRPYSSFTEKLSGLVNQLQSLS